MLVGTPCKVDPAFLPASINVQYDLQLRFLPHAKGKEHSHTHTCGVKNYFSADGNLQMVISVITIATQYIIKGNIKQESVNDFHLLLRRVSESLKSLKFQEYFSYKHGSI